MVIFGRPNTSTLVEIGYFTFVIIILFLDSAVSDFSSAIAMEGSIPEDDLNNNEDRRNSQTLHEYYMPGSCLISYFRIGFTFD